MCPAEPQRCGDPEGPGGVIPTSHPPKATSALAGLWGHLPPPPEIGSKGTVLGRSLAVPHFGREPKSGCRARHETLSRHQPLFGESSTQV